MRFIMVCLFATIVLVCVFARPDGEYTTKYDNIDLDQILSNERLLNRYIDCVLERNKGRCPPEAIELKRVLTDALETECLKCSDRQKEMAKKTIRHLSENKKNEWNELKQKYDPEGKYAQHYEEMAKKEGVQI